MLNMSLPRQKVSYARSEIAGQAGQEEQAPQQTRVEYSKPHTFARTLATLVLTTRKSMPMMVGKKRATESADALRMPLIESDLFHCRI